MAVHVGQGATREASEAVAVSTVTTKSACSLVPPSVLRRCARPQVVLESVARHAALHLDELLQCTRGYLQNLGRILEPGGPDDDLRVVLVPEIWERLRPGTRDEIRRISSSLAEHYGDRPTIFSRMLPIALKASLDAAADALRARVAATAALDVDSLVDQVRFAVAGSRASARWAPDDPVYESAFAYRLVPALAWRALALGDHAAVDRSTTAGPQVPVTDRGGQT